MLATSSLSVGYELVGDRTSKFWQINPQGFRDRAPVPLVKPKDEIRIFLLGNSTAFGYGNIDNAATISAQLEAAFTAAFTTATSFATAIQARYITRRQSKKSQSFSQTCQN